MRRRRDPRRGSAQKLRPMTSSNGSAGTPIADVKKEMASAVGGAVLAEQATEQMAEAGLGQQRRNTRPARRRHQASHARRQIRAEPQARFGAESTSRCVVRDGTFYDALSATN